METAVAGSGFFDDVTPELPQKNPLMQVTGTSDEEAATSEGVRRRRHRGAHSLPPCLFLSPLQDGGEALLQVKGLREAPPPVLVDMEGGGARALWRAVFSGNRKQKKKKWGRTIPPGADRVKEDAANQRRATGDDVTHTDRMR